MKTSCDIEGNVDDHIIGTGCTHQANFESAMRAHAKATHPGPYLLCAKRECSEIFYSEKVLQAHFIRHLMGKRSPPLYLGPSRTVYTQTIPSMFAEQQRSELV